MDEKKITYNKETGITTVERIIKEDFNNEQIKSHYEFAVKENEDFEKGIRKSKKIDSTLNRIEENPPLKNMRLKELLEIIESIYALEKKFTKEQVVELVKWYSPMLVATNKKIEELQSIYDSIINEDKKKKSQ